MIREETPGIPDRVIQATVPSLWHPSPKLSETLLMGVRHAPWLRSITAERAIRIGPEPVEKRIVDVAPELNGAPGGSLFASIDAASQLVDSFGTIVPPGNLRILRLKRNILTAGHGGATWTGPSTT